MTLLLFYLTLAIGVSFLCSVLEAVLLSITPSFTESLAQDKPRSGAVLARVKENVGDSLAAILILNTFAHTMGAFGVGTQAVATFGAKWETLIAVILTLVILYFSEIIPKTLGATFWRGLAVPACYTILWLVKLVYPLVWISTHLTRLIGSKEENEVTRDEILAMVALGHKDGALVSQENQYLSNLLNLRDIPTEAVLTPRSVVHMLDQSLTVSEALDIPLTMQFSRMPIYGDSVEDVRGKVLRHDLFAAERAGKGSDRVSDYAKPIYRVSEKVPVQHLLDLFIRQKAHLFLVEDEFGQNAGIVTLEDAIETLLGREIVDESDLVPDMQALARDRYRDRLRSIQQAADSKKNDPKKAD